MDQDSKNELKMLILGSDWSGLAIDPKKILQVSQNSSVEKMKLKKKSIGLKTGSNKCYIFLKKFFNTRKLMLENIYYYVKNC